MRPERDHTTSPNPGRSLFPLLSEESCNSIHYTSQHQAPYASTRQGCVSQLKAILKGTCHSLVNNPGRCVTKYKFSSLGKRG